MTEEVQVTSLLASVDPQALPFVIIIIVLGYLYFKFRRVEADRIETKQHRDRDSEEIHDMLMKNTWEINRIKEDNSHRDILLEDLKTQVNIVNKNLAILSTKLDNLVEVLKGKK